MPVKHTTAAALVMILDDIRARDNETRAKRIVEAFRRDLKELGEYNAYALLEKRIASVMP